MAETLNHHPATLGDTSEWLLLLEGELTGDVALPQTEKQDDATLRANNQYQPRTCSFYWTVLAIYSISRLFTRSVMSSLKTLSRINLQADACVRTDNGATKHPGSPVNAYFLDLSGLFHLHQSWALCRVTRTANTEP